jgi:hypothetical protein
MQATARKSTQQGTAPSSSGSDANHSSRFLQIFLFSYPTWSLVGTGENRAGAITEHLPEINQTLLGYQKI